MIKGLGLMMFSCLFHRFRTVLQILRPSFLPRKTKALLRATLSLVSLSICHSHLLFLSFILIHTNPHIFISVLCVLSVLFVFICKTCLTTQGSLMIPVRSGAIWLLKLVLLFSVRPRWDKFWSAYSHVYWYCILFFCMFV